MTTTIHANSDGSGDYDQAPARAVRPRPLETERGPVIVTHTITQRHTEDVVFTVPSDDRPSTPTADLANLPALLTVPRAAELLGLPRASAYRYAANGELPTQRLGGRVYIVTAQIRHLFAARESA
ncbi:MULTISPECIES: helix-turn-helix domain-containing protein [Protofrankia]|uniref:Helix-turn-helix domain-containing protein n=1 Tax=Candidatus Protofrankia datiscae TaxID=2716812 RepID=F8AX94_9ACTN|nr:MULTISPECIES: helix-turn-helix domain-containing protein [Protofrankia]AEH08445.1 hypothetical protein FsymDg_0939 [Candidatus Protofrankia datiscae]